MSEDQDESRPAPVQPRQESQPPPRESVQPRRRSWAWPTAWMVTIFLLVGGAVLTFRSCYQVPVRTIEKSGEVVEKLGEAMQSVAAAWRRGSIHTSFSSYATTISTTRYFQFATLKQMERFERSDARAIGFVPLPEVVVEARAPIEYTYYLDLNGKWEFILKDGVMHVYPPPIEFNQPAVDVARLEVEVRRGLVGSDHVRDDLTRSMSFLSREKARANIPLVKETARKAVTDFVERWLMKAFSDGGLYPVKVHFADETEADPLLVRPAD